MKKFFSTNLQVLMIVAAAILLGSLLLKYVILFFGTLIICLVGFLIYELL
jgi:hypothetical protein